jgi:hypothetical protein
MKREARTLPNNSQLANADLKTWVLFLNLLPCCDWLFGSI